jgi:hypothetical protein
MCHPRRGRRAVVGSQFLLCTTRKGFFLFVDIISSITKDDVLEESMAVKDWVIFKDKGKYAIATT